MNFLNVYEDARRAEAYAKLEFPGTYYLAYRDLPEIIREHVGGKRVFDFGCGTGRSGRFLKELGFDVTGVDISEDMIKKAVELDHAGNYIVISDGDFSRFEKYHYDLVTSIFTFDNIPDAKRRTSLLKGLGNLLKSDGKMILLGSTPEIYMNEWESFSTRDFPKNKLAGKGDRVKIITTVIEDSRPVEDIIWFDEDYKEMFKQAGLELVKSYKPLGKEDEPFKWVNETRIAPWIIYLIKVRDAALLPRMWE